MYTTLNREAKRTEERAWLGEVSAVVLQQSLRDLDTAYKNFFDSLKGKRSRMGAPRFKSRTENRQALRFTTNARWSITTGGDLRLPKVGDVRVKWSRNLPSTPSTVTVIKDAAGRYFASFVVETAPEALPATEAVVGIDLGLTHFAILSDGTKIDSPRFLRRAEKKLKKAQQNLSRKARGSANRARARVKVARAHARTADARREFHHQLSTKLIRENQAVAVEDLAVKGLARTRMAKSVHDAGWSAFTTMLEYKAARYGRTFIRIGRFEPTSQVCSTCGVKDGPKPLHIREWTWRACGVVLDRDINAAVNVAKAAGLAVSACGARVRPGLVPAQREETGTHRDGQMTMVGIPSLQGGERKSMRPPGPQRTRVLSPLPREAAGAQGGEAPGDRGQEGGQGGARTRNP
ncbi:RNA-guided endonuclease InsQ/TnpB family protein [Streptomyces flavotricini]|uniref:RNA-guided endonuclease InsQ/TnpB family protein n=1 Tax=Streptomyces flavotricini TaxID=66888 RepID=UPI001E33EA83|nr:transposase [Streptomyces flavotricini]